VPKRTPPTLRARLRPRLADDPAPAGAPEGDEVEWEAVECTGVALPEHLDALLLTGSRLRRVAFTGCRIDRFEASDSVLEDCELSGALLSGARLERVELRRCRMSGVDLSRATLRDVLLDDCRIDQGNFRAATLDGVDAVDCDLREGDLYGAEVARSNLLRSDLAGADFSKCRLRRVLLHGSNLLGLKGGAALAGIIVSRDQVMSLAPSLVTALGIVVDDDFRDAATPG
jgi:uncharacterized protein YjbI with pentapeptide repeats